MKSYLYHIKAGQKTKILKIDRLEALDIIDRYEHIDLGVITSSSYGNAIKVYREFGPYIEVKNENELLGAVE
jgi:hypothetical protein